MQPQIDSVFNAIAINGTDSAGRGRVEWLKRLEDHDLLAELLIHISTRRHWPDYKQLVYIIEGAIEGELDDIESGRRTDFQAGQKWTF